MLGLPTIISLILLLPNFCLLPVIYILSLFRKFLVMALTEFNIISEGRKSQAGQLKMLPGKGQSDDGNGQEHPESQMGQADPYSSDDDPEDVHKQVEATRRGFAVTDLLPEGPQCKHPQFNGLQPERNANDRDNQHNTCCEIFQGCDQTP